MAIPKIVKLWNLFMDGASFAGVCTEVTEPKLSMKTDDHQGGGMDAPITVSIGMEKLEMSFTLAEHSDKVKRKFGVPGTRFELRQALADDATVVPKTIVVVGTLVEDEAGATKGGDKGELKNKVGGITYYKCVMGGETIHEIDILNSKRVIDGKDQLADLRAAVGL